jgi:hypothetical protein
VGDVLWAVVPVYAHGFDFAACCAGEGQRGRGGGVGVDEFHDAGYIVWLSGRFREQIDVICRS